MNQMDTEMQQTAHEFLAALFDEGRVNEELRRTDPAAYHAKMEAEMPMNTCCFCRAAFKGYGNNPRPVLEGGVACDTCDRVIVWKARLRK